MTNQYSDNNLPQIDLGSYLPEVYRSDINKTLSEMVFNRHLTKDDTTEVVGYVGKGSANATALANRQIQEISFNSQNRAHRQAYQLAPTMYNKIGTVETALSFQNFLTQLELQGVDKDRLPLWADAINFNWIPPINIDMFANYQDYFWISNDPTDVPQYFTIENVCNKSTDRVVAYKNLMSQRGLQFPIIDVDFVANAFVVNGRLDNIFSPGDSFSTTTATTPNLTNKNWTVVNIIYDTILHTTTITVGEQIAPTVAPISPSTGDWYYDNTTSTLYVWDGSVWNASTAPISAQISVPAVFPIISINFANNTFTISDKQDDIFTATFVFNTQDTSDVNLLNKFWTTVSSTYDLATNRTTITVVEPIAAQGDPNVEVGTIVGEWLFDPSTNILYSWNGTGWTVASQNIVADISLEALLVVYQSQLNCLCNQELGWDVGLWDDNNGGSPVLWNAALLAAITLPTAPASPTYLDMWYEPVADELRQYSDPQNRMPSDVLFAPEWMLVVGNFSSLLAKTTNNERWDQTDGCVQQIPNHWSSQNHWKHKTAITSFANAKRAQLPILEYDSRMEVNEWTQIQRSWKYRSVNGDQFNPVASQPSRIELEPIKNYFVDGSTATWYLYLFDTNTSMNVNIDYTDTFVPGYKFRIVDDANVSNVYTVASAEFRDMSTSIFPQVAGNYMATVVTLVETTFTSATSGGGVLNARIIPSATSLGDNWMGYHVHWVLEEAVGTVPVRHQQKSVFLLQDRASAGTTYPVMGNSSFSTFVPQIGQITIGPSHQEFTVDVNNITTIDLVQQLQYTNAGITPYALPNTNELRVYINGIRQYGTYTENTLTATVPATVVGSNVLPAHTFEYVSSITLVPTTTLKIGDTVKIEVGPASFADMGQYNVPVRTIEDDVAFDNAVVALTQPQYMSLTEFELNEQTKTITNQYPLFNIFNLLSGELVKAAPSFSYVEDPESPINTAVQRRLLTSTSGTEYKFHQDLVATDDGMLYAFRQRTVATGTYWYSPLLSKVQYWDGYTWTDHVILTANTGTVVRTPVVSDTDPTYLHNIDQALWLNTTNNVLYRRNAGPGNWATVTPLIVESIDPTLQTVWQRGVGTSTYTPQYVDEKRNPIAVGSLNGDWGVVDQWIYNPEHKNKQEVLYSQVITHLISVIKNQPPVQGLLGGGTYSNLQSEYDYTVGGTIHEYNGAFDTLISAINVNNTTPLSVIDFAANEYSANIRYVRDIFNKHVVSLFSQYTAATLTDFTSFITESVISLYEQNDALARIYGDTTAYDFATDTGVRNWIATAPMFGLAPLVRPYVINDGTLIQVIHHDGHRTTITYTPGEEDAFARQITLQPDPRAPGYTLGAVGTTTPPTTEAAFTTAFGGGPRTGVFWYQSVSGTQDFYRFEAYTVGPVAPSFYINGVEIPDGTMYYNTITHSVGVKSGLSWVPYVYGVGEGELAPLWNLINFEEVLSEIYLEIETRLYARCQGVVSAFDYSSLTPTPEEQLVYDGLYQDRFETYVTNFGIQSPYVNTQYRQADAFTWNYLTSTILTPPRAATVAAASSWQQIYTNWYGTPYPHLEPWALQGYQGKPTWWDAYYLETNGTRRWKFTYNPTMLGLGDGMWENIRIGIIPIPEPGKPIPTYPNGVNATTGNPSTDLQPPLLTYNYFPVNISDVTITGGYAPDALLPPYYSTNDQYNHSIFTAITQISAPDADYVFGNGSVVEWNWLVSSQHPYDNIVIAYLMQPVRFLRASFGAPHVHSNQLEVDSLFGQVYSHLITLFHGDIINTTEIYKAYGLNQWYVNFNRFTGYDTSDDFRKQWVGWTPLLTYQCNSILDTETLRVSNPNFEVVTQDYNVILARDGAIKDIWVDAFDVTVLSFPPSIIQYNNQAKWKLEINSKAAISRTISYYDVKAYPFNVNTTTNVGTLYQYNIVSGGTVSTANRFYIDGEVTNIFTPGVQFVVSNTTSNDGIFTTVSSVYEPGNSRTRVNVVEPIVGFPSSGTINVNNFTMPWNTGDMVVFSSTYMLPAPLMPNTPYYIIAGSNQQFQIAETFNDAITNNPIDITTVGSGLHTVAEIASTFKVFGGTGYSKETWYHYALDKSIVRTMTPPYTINGIQTLINIIDGHAAFQEDNGIQGNSIDANDFDPLTSRPVTWALEVERFINWAFGLRNSKLSISERFALTPNLSDSTFAFVDSVPYWPDGTAIQFSSTGTLPIPLNNSSVYYVFSTATPGVIKVSTSPSSIDPPFGVTLTTIGSGVLYGSTANALTASPSFELNPIRNNVWILTPEGLLSDVTQGSYSDIRVKQTIFDQYGRAIPSANLLTFRQDKRSRVAIVPELPNDVDRFFVNDPYNFIHIGGGHFFIEGYEHYLIFNPYTVGGTLIYDSFLGLNTTKFELDFFKKVNPTLRPTLGGYYMIGNEFRRNIEGSATDLKNFYDTYSGSDSSKNVKLARSLLGYSGDQPYMEQINVQPKAQFQFYRGMLHSKGSMNSVLAYINSRRFIDAKLDEVWAYKLAEFGDNRLRVYPEVVLFATDGLVNDVRLYFQGLFDDPQDATMLEAVDEKGFKVVSFGDDSRWNNFPEQRANIMDPLFLDAELHTTTKIFASEVPPSKIHISSVDYWYNTTDRTLHIWNGSDWETTVADRILTLDPAVPGPDTQSHVLWRHSEPCDGVRVAQRQVRVLDVPISIISSYSDDNVEPIANGFSVYGNLTNYIYSSTQILVSGTTNDGNYVVDQSVYDINTNITYIIVTTPVANNGTGGTLVYTYADLNFFDTKHYQEGDSGLIQFKKINSEVVRFDATAFSGIMIISTVRPSYAKINPARLVDRTTDQVISQITLWHPAYGWHYYNALYNIDFVEEVDPARYSNSLDSTNIQTTFWNNNEAGKVWFDTSQLGYIPYYDDIINPDINTRLYSWGNLAPYANVGVYQWVRSTVPPSQWNATATTQQGNISINPSVRITGTARTTLFRRDRTISTGTMTVGNPALITTPGTSFEDGQQVFFTSTTGTLNGIALDEPYFIRNITTVNGISPYQTFNISDSTINDTVVVATGVSTTAEVVNVGDEAHSILQFQVATGVLTEGDYVQFSTIVGGQLPSPVAVSTNYVVTNLVDVPNSGYQTFGVITTGGTPVTVTDIGWGNLTVTISAKNISVVPEFNHFPFVKQTTAKQRIMGAWLLPWNTLSGFEPTIYWTDVNDIWTVGDQVEVYQNGVFVMSSNITFNITTNMFEVSTLNTGLTIQQYDIIDIFRPLHAVTAAEADFDPDINDDGTTTTQWKEDFEYSQGTIQIGSALTNVYYFWVQNSTVDDPTDRHDMSLLQITQALTTMPDPYFIVQLPKDSTTQNISYGYDQPDYGTVWSMGEVAEIFYDSIPIMYREAIFRNAAKYIHDDTHTMIQFTRDLALRDTTVNRHGQMNLKEIYSEWELFRQNQSNNLPQNLWNKLVEALSGVSLTDGSAVPSADRVLYDAKYDSDTQYGFGVGQAFVNKEMGINTLLNYLQDPEHDFTPIDINDFFARHDFTTSAGITSALVEIYETFGAMHVNGIWFNILQDALTLKSKYRDLFKTSWIALHGIQVLDVNGLFDD